MIKRIFTCVRCAAVIVSLPSTAVLADGLVDANWGDVPWKDKAPTQVWNYINPKSMGGQVISTGTSLYEDTDGKTSMRVMFSGNVERPLEVYAAAGRVTTLTGSVYFLMEGTLAVSNAFSDTPSIYSGSNVSTSQISGDINTYYHNVKFTRNDLAIKAEASGGSVSTNKNTLGGSINFYIESPELDLVNLYGNKYSGVNGDVNLNVTNIKSTGSIYGYGNATGSVGGAINVNIILPTGLSPSSALGMVYGLGTPSGSSPLTVGQGISINIENAGVSNIYGISTTTTPIIVQNGGIRVSTNNLTATGIISGVTTGAGAVTVNGDIAVGFKNSSTTNSIYGISGEVRASDDVVLSVSGNSTLGSGSVIYGFSTRSNVAAAGYVSGNVIFNIDSSVTLSNNATAIKVFNQTNVGSKDYIGGDAIINFKGTDSYKLSTWTGTADGAYKKGSSQSAAYANTNFDNYKGLFSAKLINMNTVNLENGSGLILNKGSSIGAQKIDLKENTTLTGHLKFSNLSITGAGTIISDKNAVAGAERIFENVSLNSGLNVVVYGTAGSIDSSVIKIIDTLTLEGGTLFLSSGTSTFDFLDLVSGDKVQIFSLADSNIMGSFGQLELPGLAAGLAWDSEFLYSEGYLTISTINTIPEPSSYTMILGLSCAGILASRRRKK